MSLAIQTLLGNRVKLGTDELIKQIDDLGDERMKIRPMGKCRNALDQAAECALIAMYCSETIKHGGYSGEFDFNAFQKMKDDLASDWDKLKTVLVKNADDLAAVALTVPDEKLPIKLNLPWGELSYEDVIIYPYWNLSYHTGQVTYINFLTA
jgi:hypothetical protein